MEESRLRKTSDIDIGVSIIVIVAHGRAHSVEGQFLQSRLRGFILEPAIPEVPVKGVLDRAGALPIRGLATVDEEDVEQAVTVIVQECHPTAGGLDHNAIR